MKRLDAALVERGYAASRQRAKERILQGCVSVNGKVCTKASHCISEMDQILLTGEGLAYVGRGGLKLEAALRRFPAISLKGAVCMDIGASTGGFTDCMLQNGAARIYAVDVGKDQLAQKLREDSRVINWDQTDIRSVPKNALERPVDFLSVDVSFISLRHIFPAVDQFLRPDGYAVFLIKPQFEAGREGVGKNGIVRERSVHLQVLETILACLPQYGLSLLDLCPSPIRGGSGNIEYLAIVRHGEGLPYACDPSAVVRQAFA